ncbi:MAG: hypothetical protein ACOCYE_09405, partial [Pseudomonadota bacterium]
PILAGAEIQTLEDGGARVALPNGKTLAIEQIDEADALERRARNPQREAASILAGINADPELGNTDTFEGRPVPHDHAAWQALSDKDRRFWRNTMRPRAFFQLKGPDATLDSDAMIGFVGENVTPDVVTEELVHALQAFDLLSPSEIEALARWRNPRTDNVDEDAAAAIYQYRTLGQRMGLPAPLARSIDRVVDFFRTLLRRQGIDPGEQIARRVTRGQVVRESSGQPAQPADTMTGEATTPAAQPTETTTDAQPVTQQQWVELREQGFTDEQIQRLADAGADLDAIGRQAPTDDPAVRGRTGAAAVAESDQAPGGAGDLPQVDAGGQADVRTQGAGTAQPEDAGRSEVATREAESAGDAAGAPVSAAGLRELSKADLAAEARRFGVQLPKKPRKSDDPVKLILRAQAQQRARADDPVTALERSDVARLPNADLDMLAKRLGIAGIDPLYRDPLRARQELLPRLREALGFSRARTEPAPYSKPDVQQRVEQMVEGYQETFSPIGMFELAMQTSDPFAQGQTGDENETGALTMHPDEYRDLSPAMKLRVNNARIVVNEDMHNATEQRVDGNLHRQALDYAMMTQAERFEWALEQMAGDPNYAGPAERILLSMFDAGREIAGAPPRVDVMDPAEIDTDGRFTLWGMEGEFLIDEAGDAVVILDGEEIEAQHLDELPVDRGTWEPTSEPKVRAVTDTPAPAPGSTPAPGTAQDVSDAQETAEEARRPLPEAPDDDIPFASRRDVSGQAGIFGQGDVSPIGQRQAELFRDERTGLDRTAAPDEGQSRLDREVAERTAPEDLEGHGRLFASRRDDVVEDVEINPRFSTLASMIRNSQFQELRAVLYPDGQMVVGDADMFLHGHLVDEARERGIVSDIPAGTQPFDVPVRAIFQRREDGSVYASALPHHKDLLRKWPGWDRLGFEPAEIGNTTTMVSSQPVAAPQFASRRIPRPEDQTGDELLPGTAVEVRVGPVDRDTWEPGVINRIGPERLGVVMADGAKRIVRRDAVRLPPPEPRFASRRSQTTEALRERGDKLVQRLQRDPDGMQYGIGSIGDYLAEAVDAELREGLSGTTEKAPADYLGPAYHLVRSRARGSQESLAAIGEAVGAYLIDQRPDAVRGLMAKLQRFAESGGRLATTEAGFGEFVRRWVVEGRDAVPDNIAAPLQARTEKYAPQVWIALQKAHAAYQAHMARAPEARMRSYTNDRQPPPSVSNRAEALWHTFLFNWVASGSALDTRVRKQVIRNLQRTSGRLVREFEQRWRNSPADITGAHQSQIHVPQEVDAAMLGLESKRSREGLRVVSNGPGFAGLSPDDLGILQDAGFTVPVELNQKHGDMVYLTDYTVQDVVDAVGEANWDTFEFYGWARVALNRRQKSGQQYPGIEGDLPPDVLNRELTRIESEHPHFREQFDRLNEFMDQLLLVSVMSGELTAEQAARIKQKWGPDPDEPGGSPWTAGYWPLPRRFGRRPARPRGGLGAEPEAGIERAFGSQAPFENILEAMRARLTQALEAYANNRTMLAVRAFTETAATLPDVPIEVQGEIRRIMVPLALDWKQVAELEPAEQRQVIADYLNAERARELAGAAE